MCEAEFFFKFVALIKSNNMFFRKLTVLLLAVFVFACSSQKETAKSPAFELDLNNDDQKIAYSIGLNVAKNLKTQGMDSLDMDALMQAFKDVYKEDTARLTEEESNAFIQTYFQKMAQEGAVKNLQRGQEFLAENAEREEVTVLESGLQYEVVRMGNGPKPAASDQVMTHYHGMLIDGTVFDSSVQRGEPVTFPLNNVIAGWTEALQLMPVGSKWILYIPPNLAYGEQGTGGPIGPNETLIFEVELLEIK